MRKKRSLSWLVCLLLTILCSAGLTTPSQAANASSTYDAVYQTTNVLQVQDDNPSISASLRCSTPGDITYDWERYIIDPSRWSNSSDAWVALAQTSSVSFSEARLHGNWGVSQVISRYSVSRHEQHVVVFWTEDQSLSLDWTYESTTTDGTAPGAGLTYYSNTSQIHVAEISCYYGRVLLTDVGALSVDPNLRLTLSTSYEAGSLSGMPIKNWYINVGNPNYPAGYEGAPVRQEEPAANYVAMGDSFSSGDGNSPFEPGTDSGGVNECHRSSQAYPHSLQNNQSLNLGTLAFVACAGATTSDVLYDRTGPGNWSEGAQVRALSSDTQKITITIGGNDVGFAAVATMCITAPCGPGSSEYEDSMDAITNELGNKLATVYTTLLSDAPNADIYVLGYPHITPEDPSGIDCAFLADSMPGVGINDAIGGRMLVDALNTKISSTVLSVQNSVGPDADRLHFVDATGIGNGFEGHDVCAATPNFVYPFAEVATHNWLHPNSGGHQVYEGLLEAAIN